MPTLKYASDAEFQADFEKVAAKAGVKVNKKIYSCAFSETGAVYHMPIDPSEVSLEALAKGMDVSLVRLVLPKNRRDGSPMEMPSGYFVVNLKYDAKKDKATAELRTPSGKSGGIFPVTIEKSSGGKSTGVATPKFSTSVHHNYCGSRYDITIDFLHKTFYIGAAWC